MVSITVMVLAVVFPFIPAVRLSGDLVKLECDPAVGIASQTTHVTCRFRDINKDITIEAVSLKKVGQSTFIFKQIMEKIEPVGTRFSLNERVKGPSLAISATEFSDEGGYEYDVFTNRGLTSGKFSITVIAKYKDPVVNTWPETATEGGPLELYCNATEGYPAGSIHWFDRYGTDWTANSKLTKIPKDINGLKSVDLSSKLTFKSIDLSTAPFKCVVHNNKSIRQGETTVQIMAAKLDSKEVPESKSNTTNIVAGVMVIGSLITGLLFALLFVKRRRSPSYELGKDAEGI